jgi:hypothetical protein
VSGSKVKTSALVAGNDVTVKNSSVKTVGKSLFTVYNKTSRT